MQLLSLKAKYVKSSIVHKFKINSIIARYGSIFIQWNIIIKI